MHEPSSPPLQQLHPEGQPIHFAPFFLAFTMYATAAPIITISIAIAIISFMFILHYYIFIFFFDENEYSTIFLSAFLIRYITIAAITATAMSPGKNPTPKAPVVITVPI